MTPEVRHIVETLRENSFKVFFVGGWVRDRIMRLNGHNIPESHDIDITTNATPDDIERIFPNDRTGFVGRSFGVSLVNGIDVATFRSDDCYGLSDKNLTIKFVSTIEEDLSRRDFTMNAIAFDPISEEYIDPYDGINDIRDKNIVFVGDADRRIFEDPCRILRALRFMATFDLNFPINTTVAITTNSHMVNLIPRERIRLEILKTLERARYASRFFTLTRRFHILQYIFLSLDDCFAIPGGRHHGEDLFEHAMLTGDFLPREEPLLRLAGFIHDVGKVYARQWCEKTEDWRFRKHDKVGAEIVERELRNLHFSNDEISLITGLINTHMRVVKGDNVKKSTTRRTLRRLDELNIPLDSFILMRVADNFANVKKRKNSEKYEAELRATFDEVLNEPCPISVKMLVLNGEDVMLHLGITPGPTVGKVLKELLEMVLENPSLNTRGLLLELMMEMDL